MGCFSVKDYVIDMNKVKLYLAGPEVFLPNVLEIRSKKLKICDDFGFFGVFPVDESYLPALQTKRNEGLYLCRKNKRLIAQATGIIANVTPFRGVSIDPGTAYEIGYADALRRPIFAYSNIPGLFLDRMESYDSVSVINGKTYDSDGFLIEDFDLYDNLMISGSINDSTKTMLISEVDCELGDLTLFEKAVIEARKYFDDLEDLNLT